MDHIEQWLGLPLADLDAKLREHGIADAQSETFGGVTYVYVFDTGLAFVGQESRVDCVQLYAEGVDDYAQFQGPLPGGAHFGLSREAAHALLGKPVQTGGGMVVPGLGKQTPWDRFLIGDVLLRLDYTPEEDSVTIAYVEKPEKVQLERGVVV
jgi:hypothetical protein